MDTLAALRTQLDQLDEEIASLLNARMHMVDQIGELKRKHQIAVIDASREQAVIHGVEHAVTHPVLKEGIGRIYAAIIEAAKTSQRLIQAPTCPFRRIGVIGLGLIGGSLCKAIKLKDPSVTIATLRQESDDYKQAKTGGWIDQTYASMPELMQQCDLIILASPISTIIPLAQEIGRYNAPSHKLVVIDVASVKTPILEVFEKLSDKYVEYIGTHPMSGKERSGFVNSDGTLFVGNPWVIVSHTRNSAEALSSVQDFIQSVGSHPVRLDATTHDQYAALISHLPGVISKEFYQFVRNLAPDSLQIAGPGFRSFTRLAHDNGEMRHEIASSNAVAIQHYMRLWLDHCDIYSVKQTTGDALL